MKSHNTLKGFGLLIAMLFCCGFAFAQPLNDVCSNSEDIDCGDVVSGSTIGATFDNVGTCGTSNTAAGVWYNIPGTGGAITVSTCNQASYDTKISVFSGSCGSLTCVGGQDDAAGCSGFTTEFTWLSNAANDYLVLVHGFGTATGTFNLSASCASAPSGNDACTGATAIACGDVVSGSTSGATADFAPFCGTSNSAPGVWYEIAPPAGTTIDLTTCSPNTNYDTKLTVYTGGCGSLTCVDGNDDDFSCGNSIFQSRVTICGDGSTYLVLVHGFGTGSGDFELTVSCSSPPANDAACGAEALAMGGSAAFNNNCASAQAGEATPGPGTGASSCDSQDGWCDFTFTPEPQADNSLWYSFVAPAGGCVTIDATGFDSQLAVWSATDCADFSTYTLEAANDDGGAGLEAQITELSCLTAGATYLVQVDGFGGASGDGTISITDCGNDPLAVDLGDCQSALTGTPTVQDTNYLVAAISGGFPPYDISWSGNDVLFTDANQAAVYAANVGSNTFTVTVTDANGCSASDDVEVVLYDINACTPPNRQAGPKVQVCHVPPGNPANEHEICIDMSALPAHLTGGGRGHGTCYVGPCKSNNPCLATNPAFEAAPACVDLTINILTDNFPTETSWELRENGTLIASTAAGTYTVAGTNVQETFCVDPRNCYDVTIFDSFGDGICCGFGNGAWSVDYDGVNNPSPTGSAFGSDENIQVGSNCKNSQSTERLSNAGVKLAAYPNPFTDQATIKFIMNETGNVRLEMFSLTGKNLAVLFDGVAEAGTPYVQEFDGTSLENGLYIYRLVGANGVVESGKIVLNK